MLTTHFKTAFRYLRNHSSYAFINIAGLTMGFFCFLLLNGYVGNETSFDSQFPGSFRLLQHIVDENGAERQTAILAPRIGVESKEQFPEIEALAQLFVLGRITVGNDPGSSSYEQVTAISEEFFNVFDLKFHEGSPMSVFLQPSGVLLTRTLKEKYFGSASALGASLKTNLAELIVAGVIEDFPSNTHLEAQLILPPQTTSTVFNWYDNFYNSNWHRNAFVTYFKLRPDTDIASLGHKITRLTKENYPEGEPFRSTFTLQPVGDIHLYAADVEGEVNAAKGNPFYVKVFFWIALVILLVACFNYTGLLNIAFMGRSREIGVRKVVGANRRQLLWQFLSESLLLTSVALFLAIALLQLSEPWLPRFFGASFDLSTIPFSRLLLVALAGIAVSLLSILYPSWLITRLATVKALKNEHSRGAAKWPVRKVMTVFQFTAAIALVAITIVFSDQVKYLQQKELGFDMEGLVVVDINSGILRSKFESIKEEFGRLPEVANVSVSSRVPGEWKQVPLARVLRKGQEKSGVKEMIFICTDQDFLDTYEVNLLSGKNFSGVPADSTKVMLNQTAVRKLGLEDPVGQWVEVPEVNWSGDTDELEETYRVQVTGVVEDFHFEDFQQTIRPMVIGYWVNPIHNIDYYTLRVNTTDWSSTIASLRRINDSFDAENPLEYNILGDQFSRFYEDDLLRSRLLGFFTGIVVFIACMGLFAISAFVVRRRTKEIGIRKVLGANTSGIISLLSRDYVKMVGVAFLVAAPPAWYFMEQWLENFAYRIEIGWWVFALAGIAALIIAFVTVSFQSVKAALANPVESLRSE